MLEVGTRVIVAGRPNNADTGTVKRHGIGPQGDREYLVESDDFAVGHTSHTGWAGWYEGDQIVPVGELQSRQIDQLTADLAAVRAKCEAYEEALTPDADTKYAYHGEFWWEEERPTIDEDGDVIYSTVKYVVPWTTIKEIMAAIRKRAESALATPADPQDAKEAP